MRALLIVVAASCGGAQHTGNMQSDRSAVDAGMAKLFAARGNPKAIAAMLDAPIVFGGMWFDEPVCRARFGHAGPVEKGHFDALAKCISALPLAASTRTSPLPVLGVITYGPGIEIEALFAKVGDDVKIKWLGFVSSNGEIDAQPTVTQTALEALREPSELAADVRSALDAERATQPKLTRHTSWLKVCVDANGAVTSVAPLLATTALAHDTFVAHAKTWRFKPFAIGDKPVPVCSVVHVSYPASEDTEAKLLPYPLPAKHTSAVVVSFFGMGKRIEGEPSISTDANGRLLEKYRVSRVDGHFFYCIDPRGAVSDVTVLHSTRYPLFDEAYQSLVRRWRFEPSGRAVCTFVRFVLEAAR
jgi:hypothetical protein